VKLPALLLALSLSLFGCASTPPPRAPAKIDPPPVALAGKCPSPDGLPEGATAQDLSAWVIGWIGTAGCERAKRQALLEAWPR
jgi:hypothetical protein